MRWLVCRPHWRRKRNRYEGAARRKSAAGFALRRFPPRTFIDYTYPQQLNDERLSPRGQNSTRTGGQNSMRADMTAPMNLPLIGEIKVREISKEELMGIWTGVLEKARPEIRFSERMEEITQTGTHFTIRTNKATYATASILLAIGRRGTPRKLGARGEEHPKVVYRLIEADQYRGKHILVVGGGDSALEAALDISNEPGTTVILSYRGKAFDRVKPKNRTRLADAIAAGRIEQILESTVDEIRPDSVLLKHGGELIERRNEGIIVCAGGELPTPMLKKIGIQVDTRHGE